LAAAYEMAAQTVLAVRPAIGEKGTSA